MKCRASFRTASRNARASSSQGTKVAGNARNRTFYLTATLCNDYTIQRRLRVQGHPGLSRSAATRSQIKEAVSSRHFLFASTSRPVSNSFAGVCLCEQYRPSPPLTLSSFSFFLDIARYIDRVRSLDWVLFLSSCTTR